MKFHTELLSDSPVGRDAFGSHSRIAGEILTLIRTQSTDDEKHSPRAIALLGDWGSGKSSVVRMLRDRLTAEGQEGPVETAFILYDAWAHEGDGLRRAFLDALTFELSSALSPEELKAIKRDVWDRKETTSTISEPILRPHARTLLLSLLPVPFALSLFGNWPDSWFEIYEGAWSFLMLLLLALPAAVMTVFALIRSLGSIELRKKVFGVEDEAELSKVSLTSFFFNKVDGKVDHKWTTSPIDSIQQFRTAFQAICDLALKRYRTLVLVVDNIDRLERDEARAFWATMQSFFDRSGWENSSAGRLWLIAPFSPLAVTRYFGSGDEGDESAAAEARSFVDKSFDLAFHIPPPIQVDSRSYFLGQVQTAFPEHSNQDREAVRNLFDALRSRPGGRPGTLGDAHDTRKTPRQMKLFINQLVALYRVSDNEVSLPAMALYLLLRDTIGREGFAAANRLGPYELSQLHPSPEPIQQLAAVHFGVSLDAAAQVILADPIRDAVESSNSSSLKSLSARSGFVDVLQHVVAGSAGGDVGRILARLAFLQSTLDVGRLDLHSTWTSFLGELEKASTLGSIDDVTAGALVQLAAALYPNQVARLTTVVADGLSRGWLSESQNGLGADDEPVDEYEGRMAKAVGWAAVASSLLTIGGGPVTLPQYPPFAVRALDSIAQRSDGSKLSKAISTDVDLTSSQLVRRIVLWPGEKSGPTDPVAFWNVLRSLGPENADWHQLVAAYVKNLPSSDPAAAEASVTMLVSMGFAGEGFAGAIEALKAATENGQLGVALGKIGVDNVRVMAFGLVALIAAAPENTPDVITKRGRASDKVLIDLVNNPADAVLRELVGLVKLLQIGSRFIAACSPRPAFYSIAMAVFRGLVESDYAFQARRNRLINSRAFLIWAEQNGADLSGYFERISASGALVTELGKSQIDERSAFVAHRVFRTAKGSKSVVLRNKLKKFLDSRTKQQWKSVIDGDDVLPLEIARDVRAKAKGGVLGVSAFDAVLDCASETVNGGAVTAVTDVANLLEESLRASLIPRFWSKVLVVDLGKRLEAVRLARDILSTLDGTDVTTVAGSILMPMIASPKTQDIDWIVRIVTTHLKEFERQQATTSELRARVNHGLRQESGLNEDVKRSLRKLQRALPKKGRARRRKK